MSSLETSTHIHLIGIGGTGLSAIALYLLESGYKVTGSDRQYSDLAQRVEAAGGRVFTGHQSEQVLGTDLIIRSSAIPDTNVEIIAAQSAGIPVFKRSDFLGKLMEGRQGIAVAGTHGKTTTTAMIAWMLTALDQDPSYIIGGVSKNLSTNAHAGRGAQFIIEADEYDHMFLGLRPEIAVVTTVEYDHPDCFPTPEDFYQAFVDFVGRLSIEGVLLVWADDRNALSLLDFVKGHGRTTRTFSLGRLPDGMKPDYYGENLTILKSGAFAFDVVHHKSNLAKVCLCVPGRHNVHNALAAFAVAHILGLPPDEIAKALGDFAGVSRRFEVRGEVDGMLIIDDYAHHPTEIRAALSAARDRYADKDIWAVWQPHTYSRTNVFFNEFASSFDDADHVVVTRVFAAREAVRDNDVEEELVKAMSHPDAQFVQELDQVSSYLLARLLPGSVVLILSAGDAQEIGDRLLESLSRRKVAPDE